MTQRVVNYTYGTGNPVLPNGSIDVRDGIDNLQSLDVFMNAPEDTYNQRDGEVVQTVSGAIRSVGFKPGAGDFTAGFTVLPGERDVAWYNPTDNNWYSFLGVIPSPAGYPVSSGTNPVGSLLWKPVTDQTLRGELAGPSGVDLVGNAAKKTDLDALTVRVTKLEDMSVDTVADLRLVSPTAAGEVVYVRSSITTPVGVYGYFGGGNFASYDNTQANIDDGGVFIDSPHPTLKWQRINFTEYDMRFWGLIADLPSFDNAPAITLATNFAKVRKIHLKAPPGSVYTSEMVPIYNNMGIEGHGSAEMTVFYKTTNNAFPFKANGDVAFSVDTLVGLVPKKSVAGGAVNDSETVTTRFQLKNCMFRREGLTDGNYATTRPSVGLFLGSASAGTISNVVVEGGHIGAQGWTVWSCILEQLRCVNFVGKGNIGLLLSAYTSGTQVHKTAGTSLDMRLVSMMGYQFGYQMQGYQYTTMTSCYAQYISPMAGQTTSYAFDFVNPYGITMNSCASEVVTGGQIRAQLGANVSFKASLSVSGYMTIDQLNPVAITPQIKVDSAGLGTINVIVTGGDLTRLPALSNLVAPTVSGSGAKLIKIGAGGLTATELSSGTFVDLA